jgi:hypothetical protein
VPGNATAEKEAESTQRGDLQATRPDIASKRILQVGSPVFLQARVGQDKLVQSGSVEGSRLCACQPASCTALRLRLRAVPHLVLSWESLVMQGCEAQPCDM